MASKIVVNLDTSKEVFLNSKCKQNDDLILECNIFENGLTKDLTNCSIVIQALKADKTYIIQNTDITKNKNNFIANLVRDFTRVAGETEIEIVLTESSKQNTTFSFCLEVVGSVIRGAVESKNTVTILENLQDKIEEAGVVKQETEQLIEKGGAATKGDIQEVNAHLEHNTKKSTLIINVDEYNNFQEVLDVAIKNPYSTIYFPTDYTTTNTVHIPIKTNLKMDGSIILDSNENTPAIEIGEEEDINRNVIIDLKIKRKNFTDWNNLNDIGVKLNNISSSIINVLELTGFNIGCILKANDNGIAHNIFNLTNIYLNRIDLYFHAIGEGFVNENNFIGGRFTSNYGLSESLNLKEKIGLYARTEKNSFNNNVFVKPCFQKGKNSFGFDVENFRMNTIISARYEETENIGKCGVGCELNDINIGYQTTLDIPFIDISENKTNFITSLRNIDKNKVNKLIHKIDNLKDSYCPWDTDNGYIKELSISHIGGTTHKISAFHQGVTLDDNGYINLTGCAIGVKINTEKSKKFRIVKDTIKGNEGWVCVITYNKNGERLVDGVIRLNGSGKEGERFSYDTYMGGSYRTSVGNDDVMFTVSDDVSSIWVGVGTSSSNVCKIKSIAFYSQEITNFNYGEEDVTNYLKANAMPVNFVPRQGTIVYKGGKLSDCIGWVYDSGTWKKFGALI